MRRFLIGFVTVVISGASALQPAFAAEGRYVVKPLVQKKVKQLPVGPLYWQLENFPNLAQAQAAAGSERWNPDTVSYEPATALAAEVAGKAWLFTLGPKGGSTPGGTKVAEIGPLPPINAREYLLRVNHGYGPPGASPRPHRGDHGPGGRHRALEREPGRPGGGHLGERRATPGLAGAGGG